jgi:hypothetical protein
MVGGVRRCEMSGTQGWAEPGQNPKLNRRALDLANEMWGGSFSGRGDPIEVE